ncbi:uncharacterized protein LOC142328467 isoform X3 [Lycorma delicatula]|uniref:uncharacterized protein LOC142328467 isoform X3 n=1 Tax=Lycorma delicatula TaxID=130591 RepID=UPI003F51189A
MDSNGINHHHHQNHDGVTITKKEMLETPLVTALERDSDFLARILRTVQNDPYLEIERLDTTPGSKIGDNYMSSISRIQLFGYAGKERNAFKKVVMVKRQPASLARRQAFRCDPAFVNEAAAYDTVIPALRACCNDTRLLPFPNCYFASNQVIVLQDLREDGFMMADRRKGLDFDHCTVALQALARFHAASYIMKHKDKTGFDKMRSSINELIFVPEAIPIFGASLENSLKMAISTLKHWCGPGDIVLDDAIHKLQMLQGQVFQRMVSLIMPKEPLAVICHGDFWVNNMLFKYNKDNNVEDVKFVDLQVTRYASPVTDILLFIYTSTEKGLSRNYYDNLIEIYHEELSKTISEQASNAPVISLKDLLDDIEAHALFSFLMVLLLLPAVTADSTAIDNTIYNLDAVNENTFKTKEYLDFAKECLSPRYRQIVKDMVLEYVDRGFI